MFVTERTDRSQATRAAQYLAEHRLPRIEIYKALVDDLGVAPHTALDIVAEAA